MFVKLMFFAIETHSCTATHAHTGKGKRGRREERQEINSRQRRCISINPPEYSFTLFILVLEPDCQTLFPHKCRACEGISLLKKCQQTYGFISRVWMVEPALGGKTMNAIKFVFQITQSLQGDEVCFAQSVSCWCKGCLWRSLNGTPFSIPKHQRKREISLSADQSY